MRTALFVDFENVGLPGLLGIDQLGAEDTVFLFSGAQAAKLSIEDANSLFNAAATVQLILNKQLGKNATDFVVSAYLGYKLGLDEFEEYYVISKDKGYEPALLAMRELTKNRISQADSIEAAVAQRQEREQARRRLTINGTEEEIVARALERSRSRGEFHNILMYSLRDKRRVREVYNREKHRVQTGAPTPPPALTPEEAAIRHVVENACSKADLHNNLVQLLGDAERAREVYHREKGNLRAPQADGE